MANGNFPRNERVNSDCFNSDRFNSPGRDRSDAGYDGDRGYGDFGYNAPPGKSNEPVANIVS